MKQKLSIFEVMDFGHNTTTPQHHNTTTPQHHNTTTPQHHNTGNGIGKFLKLCILMWMLMKVDVGWGQVECGFQPDQSEIDAIQNYILGMQPPNANPQQNCSDIAWNGGDVTYRLVIEYTDLTPLSVIEPVVEYTKSFYLRFGINFNVMYVRNECQNCPLATSSGWGQPFTNNINFPNCLYGRITRDCSLSLGRTVCGNGLLGKGIFFVQLPNSLGKQNMVHELGHALGLFHTFDSFSETSHEKVSPSTTCACNCLTHGDRICDTKTDPYNQDDQNWNNRMFNPILKTVQNLDNKSDICGTPFNNIPNQSKLFSNIMSYHYTSTMTFNEIEYEPGQVALIKHWNNSKPWKVDAQTGYTIMPGFVVNAPTEIVGKNYVITSDIVLSSALKLKNCQIRFTNNAKIQVLNKGDLLVDNTVLGKFVSDNNSCLNVSSEQWRGISVEATNYFPTINIKSNSIVSGVTGAVIKTGSQSKLRLFVTDNSILEGTTALDMSNKLLFAYISNSTISGLIQSNPDGPGFIRINNSDVVGITASGKNISVVNQSNILTLLATSSYGGQYLNTLNSFVQGSISLRNSGPTNISDNYFTGSVNIENVGYPKLTIRDNEFNTGSQKIIFRNNLTSNTSNLIFKNDFNNIWGNAMKVFTDNPNLNLECNDFHQDPTNSTFTTDFNLEARIASQQGDNQLAAGNLFSRTNPEINYTPLSRLDYYYKNPGTKEEPIYINGSNFFKNNNTNSPGSKCNVNYPPIPEVNPAHCFNGVRDGNEFGVDCGGSCLVSCPEIGTGEIGITPVFPAHCSNGILDGNESDIDCGGSCPPCFTNNHCSDGVMNGDETGVDCGGLDCPPCNTDYCSDGIQNNGETGIDCGGPCGPCFVNSCSNGLWDGDETGIDCGGSCMPCAPTCFDGIQNGEETGVDCGGGCASCGGNCNDGIQNNGEYFVDCGGPCSPCVFDDFTLPQEPDYTDFIDELNGIYSTSMIPTGNDIEIDSDNNLLNALYDNGNTPYIINLIETQSASNPSSVYSSLIQASPFVSPKAFHTLFKYSIHYTEQQVVDILSLNPGALEDLYVYYVVFQSGSFSNSVRQGLWSAMQVEDARTALNDKLRVKKLYMDYIINQRIVFQQEMVKPDFSKIRSQYQKNHDLDVPYFVYHTYLEEGKYNQAWNYLNGINTNVISDPYYKSQIDKLKEMEAILFDYYYAGNSVVSMPGAQRQVLIDIANTNHGLTTKKARIILESLYSMTFGDFPSNDHYQPLQFLSSSNPRTKEKPFVSVIPNPATDHIRVNLGGYDISVNPAEIRISDLSGKLLLSKILNDNSSLVDITMLLSGVYQFSILLSSGDTLNGKLVKID